MIVEKEPMMIVNFYLVEMALFIETGKSGWYVEEENEFEDVCLVVLWNSQLSCWKITMQIFMLYSDCYISLVI